MTQIDTVRRWLKERENEDKIVKKAKEETIEEVKKELIIAFSEISNTTNNKPHTKPHTKIENGIGYFKFYKQGEDIKIGGTGTRPFKFLQCLCNPNFGIEKTIEEVFESIKLKKDLKDNVLTGFDSSQKETKILTIINLSCIKELQKNKKLQKIRYKFDNNKKRVRLELEE